MQLDSLYLPVRRDATGDGDDGGRRRLRGESRGSNDEEAMLLTRIDKREVEASLRTTGTCADDGDAIAYHPVLHCRLTDNGPLLRRSCTKSA